MERYFHQGLTATNGDRSYFVTQPIDAGVWIAVLLFIVALPVVRWFIGRGRQASLMTTATERQPSV